MAISTIGTNAIASSAVTNAQIAAGSQYYSFKNRIINGAMVIDQRNAGASVTPTNTGALTYTLDRWAAYGSQASKFSVQQSSTAPSGFTKSIVATSLSAYTVGSGEIFKLTQLIEGYNSADFGFGASGSSTVTLSFWVRSSLTGTFGGALSNEGLDYAYLFSYTISAANTWEQKTVTITGATSGTWATTTGAGIQVIWSLGAGSTRSNTAGAWASGNYQSATGATSVVGTSGATFYITGVQLEKGSTATSFDYRPYGTELQLCERYYQFLRGTAVKAYSATGFSGNIILGTPMRTAPTGSIFNASSAILDVGQAFYNLSTFSAVEQTSSYGGTFNATSATNLTTGAIYFVVGQRIAFTAEL